MVRKTREQVWRELDISNQMEVLGFGRQTPLRAHGLPVLGVLERILAVLKGEPWLQDRLE